MDERVLAAVVTYHPGPDLTDNLQALRAQGADVLVIDNGSPDIAAIAAAASVSGCTLLRNADNLGLATALNQAARAAQAGAYPWLATFDQDSRVPDGALAELLALAAAHPAGERIAILAMRHRDRALGRGYVRASDVIEDGGDWRTLRAAITSGSLIRSAVFDRVGLFDERLFIDGVDHDFCLRCRRAGLLVVEGSPVLEHSLGAAATHRLFGRAIACTNHSPIRRYYITRNSLELSFRHGAGDPLWAARNLAHLADSSLSALLFEDRRAAKAAAMLQGLWHFALRRFGPRPCHGRPGRATRAA